MRLAAGGGRVDQYESQQLAAAGLTLLARCAPLVRALSGSRSAILLPTSPAFVVALAASDGRGAVLVNPLAAPAEIDYQLADADVGAVFTNSALAAKLPPSVTRVLLDDAPTTARVLLPDGATRDVDLGSHLGRALEGDRECDGRDEECAIVYTSAMEGRALGAVLTHRNLIANALATVEAGGVTAGDHSLALLPFSHLFGLTVTLGAPLCAGGRVTTMARFNPARVVEVIRSEQVTLLTGVPSVFAALLAVLERDPTALNAPALRLCICGGAPLATELQDRWANATGVELRQGYGLTEAGPVCLFNRVDHPNRRGAMGLPFPRVNVRIMSPDTAAEAPVGFPGEIETSGPNVFSGYVSGGERGLALRDGWLRTGDLGAMDADGYVSFRGVRKPMFTRNGFNIYPREIERVVAEMPGVRGVHVQAVPDPARENDIALEVEGDVGETDVRAWCEACLSAYKQPATISVRSA
ncbi:MAG: AMP-binding protein [Gemmatimonadaceae bacterium]